VPYLLLSLPVGALIDRWNRRRVMIICHLGRATTLASLPVAMVLGRLTVEQIYLVAVIEGALHVFFNIAETAALPRVVPAALLPQATAQNNAGYAMSAVVGPALGTWLYQAVSRALPFVVDAVTHLVGAVLLWRLRTSFVPAPVTTPRDLRAEVAEGLRWLWGQRLVRDMALITCVLNFVQAATPLLLIVLAKQLHASEAQIGVMFSLGGVGGILGALVGGVVARRFSFGQVIIGTIALQAVLFPVYAASTGPMWLGLVYGLIMFFGPIYNVVQLSYRIALIPDGLQGRVNSSFRLFAFGLNPVGAALCGYALEHWGTTPTVWLFGSCYALVALAAWADPAVRLARNPQAASGTI
jgi:predicted MFS family arabinose efflux permease